MQKTHSQTARLVLVPQFWHNWIVAEIRHMGGGVVAWLGGGQEKSYTLHTHIYTSKNFIKF